MSPEAERLRETLTFYHLHPETIARKIVTELRITEEMVEATGRVADMLDFMVSEEFIKSYPAARERITDVERESAGLRSVGDALSALLEVANR